MAEIALTANSCAPKTQNDNLRDVVIQPNGSGIALDQDKVDQYIKAMSLNGSEKEKSEKLAAMWMYAQQMGSLPTSVRSMTPATSRPIMLIPAGSNSMLASPPPPQAPIPMLMSAAAMPYHRGMTFTLPYMRPGSMIYAHPGSMSGTFRTHKSSKSAVAAAAAAAGHHHRRRHGAGGGQKQLRSGKMDANRRQRRKSEADILDGQAFQYTGLDRAIADNFLERQEQSHTGSHIDYSSSSSASEATYGGGRQGMPPRSPSKTKIVCRDVVM